MSFCILAITTYALNAQPVRIEQLSPCYASFEQCTAAIPGVAHRITPLADTRMAFQCWRSRVI